MEIDSDGFDFRVGNGGFVWSYPEHVAGQRQVIRTDIAVLYVGDEAEKQALLLSKPEMFLLLRLRLVAAGDSPVGGHRHHSAAPAGHLAPWQRAAGGSSPRLDVLIPVRGDENPLGGLMLMGSRRRFLGSALRLVAVPRLGRVDTVRSVTSESELAGFIAKFAPEMQCRIRGCRAKLGHGFPDAVQMVYDNYNFLVIGFGPTRRASDAILSLAAHPRGVDLCFSNVVRNCRIRRRSCAAAAR